MDEETFEHMEDEIIDQENPTPTKTATPATPAQVLIAEDDIPLAHFLQRGLQTDNYRVDLAHDGEAAASAVNQTKYDLLILDLNLPKLDGLTLLKQVRPVTPGLPILVLTARNGLEDRINALDQGADDCLIKPFSFQELLARSRALLRRSQNRSPGTMQVGDLVLNHDEFRVERGGRKIELTAKEFALLEYLMMNRGRSLSRASIMENVWKTKYDGTTNLVDVYVKYVRDKVDADFPIKLVRTIRGIGYSLGDN